MTISEKIRSAGFENIEFIDISIPLRFNAAQPNAYGVEPAVSAAYEAGGIVGDTRRGGSVNFERYAFIPHCSGTHTECVGHITHERISVRDCLKDVFSSAELVSIEPSESENGEKIITRENLEKVSGTAGALIVRTFPNDERKLTESYGYENIPPYFTQDAMRYIVERGFKHLLCDLPSIDRIFDEGKLLNHRIFWNIAEGSFDVNAETRIDSTITELIYVPNDVPDGEYGLNLQIAPFESDCAPSRPILI